MENKESCTVGVAIVDDEISLVGLYIQMLKLLGIPVCFTACNGVEAIQKFTGLAEKPPVIVMDNRMPGMNGIEAVQKILSVDPSCKIIFISADDRVEDEAMSCGATVFLKKPVSLKNLTSTIKSVLGPSLRLNDAQAPFVR